MGRLSLGVLVLTLGCGDKDTECSVGDIGGRPAAAQIDGGDWLATDGNWRDSGAAVNINLNSSDSRTINLVGKVDKDGTDVMAMIENDSFPIEIDLSDSDGYGSLMDRRNGLKGFTSNEEGGGGSLILVDVDGDTLSACFEFDGISPEGDERVEVSEGKLKIDLVVVE